mgnify:FL=1
MTRHRAINIALTTALVVAMASILSTGHLLDDNSDEWAQSSALADAEKAARSEQLRERAAAQLCIKMRGPGAGYRWTDDGDLVCHDHRNGRQAVVVASKGSAH